MFLSSMRYCTHCTVSVITLRKEVCRLPSFSSAGRGRSSIFVSAVGKIIYFFIVGGKVFYFFYCGREGPQFVLAWEGRSSIFLLREGRSSVLQCKRKVIYF